jgi:hypothetical protein
MKQLVVGNRVGRTDLNVSRLGDFPACDAARGLNELYVGTRVYNNTASPSLCGE